MQVLASMTLLSIIGLTIFFCLLVVCKGESCTAAYECTNKVVNSTNSDVECIGYFSCAYGTKIILTADNDSGGHSIRCQGSNSCNGAELITVNASDASTDMSIACFALLSCANVDYMYNANGNINCISELSCYNSHLIKPIVNISDIPDNWVSCSGVNSCKNSLVESVNTKTYSYLASVNTTFRTTNPDYFENITEISYSFAGFYGSYNTTIICGNGQTCSVVCFDNACDNTNFVCDGNCNFELNCNVAWNGKNCSNKFDYLSFLTNNNFDFNEIFPNLFDVPFTNIQDSYDACNQSLNENTVNCDDVSACSEQNISSNGGTICSTASYGVELSGYLNTSVYDIDGYIINNYESIAIRMDGYRSGYNMYGGIYGYNGDIYMTAYDVLFGVNSKFKIETFSNNNEIANNRNVTSGHNVYCTGGISCRYDDFVTFQFIKNVYCMGGAACTYSIFNFIYGNLYFYGYQSGYQTRITNLIGDNSNVYCASFQVCYESTIKNVSNSIYGIGYQVLYNSTIENVNNNIIVIGESSLQFSKLENVANVYCGDKRSCSWINLNGFDFLLVNGSDALAQSVIISGDNGNRVTIKIYDENNSNFSVYCNTSDICNIYCDSYESCINLNLYCYGECGIDCDYDLNNEDSSCVSLQYGNYSGWITNYPTEMPSVSPTKDESDETKIDDTTIIIVIAVCVIVFVSVIIVLFIWKFNGKKSGGNEDIKQNSDNNIILIDSDNINISKEKKELSGVINETVGSPSDRSENSDNGVETAGMAMTTRVNSVSHNNDELEEMQNQLLYLSEGVKVTRDVNNNDNSNNNNNNNDNDNNNIENENDGQYGEGELNAKVIGVEYESWTKEQVSEWLKNELISKQFGDELIESFINDWNEKYMTGESLKQLKNSDEMMDTFIKQFEKENQAFGIWIVVKSLISSIGESEGNVNR